jgi:hypothetical protein
MQQDSEFLHPRALKSDPNFTMMIMQEILIFSIDAPRSSLIKLT